MLGIHLFQVQKGKERVEIYYSEMTPMINQIVSMVQNEKPVLYGIYEEEKFLLDMEEIYYFDTVDRHVFAYGGDRVWQIPGTLTALEEKLKPFGFIRINKSNLVNIYCIKRIKPEANMRVTAILKNNEKLLINRGYKREFENYLKSIRRSL